MNLTLDIKKTDLQTLFTTRKYMIFAIAMVVIGVLILLFGVFAQIGGLVELINATNAEKETERSLQNKATALQQVNYMDEFSKSNNVSMALPSEKPLLQLITGVNNVAQETGVTLFDLVSAPGKLATESATTSTNAVAQSVVDTATDIPGVNVLTIGMKANGTLAQINAFLDSIEKITPITQATKLKLSVLPVTASDNPAPGEEKYEAELELSTYYYSQSISVTVDAPLPVLGEKETAFLNNLESYQFLDYQKQQEIQGGGATDLFGGLSTPTPTPVSPETPTQPTAQPQ